MLPRVFVGSSSEAKDRGIVDRLESLLKESFEVQPWYGIYRIGSFILEKLETIAGEIDAALLVFAKDAEIVDRGEKKYIARVNLSLEYGFFVGKLDRSRVLVLKEEEVELPSDLQGLEVLTFKADSETSLDSSLSSVARMIKESWGGLRRQSGTFNDAGLGISSALQGIYSKLKKLIHQLRKFAQLESSKLDVPFYLDSASACIDAYAEGLATVEERFLTTTFISSGFWIRRSLKIQHANDSLLKRVKSHGGDVRRIFLIGRPLDWEEEYHRERLSYLRQQGDGSGIDEILEGMKHLRENVKHLLDHGCAVRVAYDRGKGRDIKEYMEFFDPDDHEIAIYDDRRVDMFGGGKIGMITDVRIYSPMTAFFNTILYKFTRYFENLWQGEEAYDVEEFLKLLAAAYDSAQRRIDYTSNWLGMFDKDVNRHDRELKRAEMEFVQEYLASQGPQRLLGQFLDIGTCTGRYMIKLRDHVMTGGRIIGIDNDPDCVRYTERNWYEQTGNDPRGQVKEIDFLAPDFPDLGQFDLITCMLGTISHFGGVNRQGSESPLRFAVKRMANLLASQGTLIISKWTKEAVLSLNLLSIYKRMDVERLAKWTPSTYELTSHIESTGLKLIEHRKVTDYLDVFVYRNPL